MQPDTMPEAAGTPPAWVTNPFHEDKEEKRTPAISARFYIAPDPRTDPSNMPVLRDGKIPNVEMVDIINRNDPKNSPQTNIATDEHRYKIFRHEYARFKQGLSTQSTGTPLKDWIGEGELTQRLAMWHIHTVEQLASLADGPLGSAVGPGGFEWREKAKTFLESRKDSALAERLGAQNAAQAQQLTEMAEKMATMERMMASLQANRAAPPAPEEAGIDETNQPPRRGRPPNSSKEN